MKLGKPIQIAKDMHQIRTVGARVTLIMSGRDAVLVDAGLRGSSNTITAGLKALSVSPDHVSLIVLTHYDPDHSGGLARLAEATSAKVAVHAREASIVSGASPAPSPYRSKVLAAVARPLIAPLYGAPVDVDYLLEDGDRLPVETDIQVLHTPGHTRGSICLYLTATKVLITGDALQYRFRRLSPPAAAVTEDPKQAKESLKKLLLVDFDTLCFGHFPPLRSGARSALERLVDKHKA